MKMLRKLAYPVALLYGLVVTVRNALYDLGIFSSRTFSTPILCIGNLSVGGTGKTPMTEWLIATLSGSQKMAVLSRGYKRKSSGYLQAISGSTASDLGDEPFQMFSKFPGLCLAVDANRRRGITRLIETCKPDLILLDDAFQHRKVKPDIAILLTAYGKLYSDDFYLPTGSLRDSPTQAKRANLIIVTKCPLNITESEKTAIRQRLKPEAYQKVLFSSLAYFFKAGSGLQIPVTALQDKKITLVTGIADPTPLTDYLSDQGIAITHLRYPDHYDFPEKELNRFKKEGLLLTTEKDAARMPEEVCPDFIVGIQHRFTDKDTETIKRLIGGSGS